MHGDLVKRTCTPRGGCFGYFRRPVELYLPTGPLRATHSCLYAGESEDRAVLKHGRTVAIGRLMPFRTRYINRTNLTDLLLHPLFPKSNSTSQTLSKYGSSTTSPPGSNLP